MDIFVKSLCKETVKLEPKYLDNNFKNEIIKRLRKNLEGKCSNHGYIKKDSIEIYKIKPGIIEQSTLSGFINYDVYFHAEVCNPLNKSIIQGRVTKFNRFGILVEAGYDYEEEFITILEIIIPKNSFNIVSEIDDLNKIQIGDIVNVEILGKKYQLNDTTINVIGRIVKDDKISNIYYDKKEYHKDLYQEDEFVEIIEEDEDEEDQTKNTDLDEDEDTTLEEDEEEIEIEEVEEDEEDGEMGDEDEDEDEDEEDDE